MQQQGKTLQLQFKDIGAYLAIHIPKLQRDLLQAHACPEQRHPKSLEVNADRSG